MSFDKKQNCHTNTHTQCATVRVHSEFIIETIALFIYFGRIFVVGYRDPSIAHLINCHNDHELQLVEFLFNFTQKKSSFTTGRYANVYYVDD